MSLRIRASLLALLISAGLGACANNPIGAVTGVLGGDKEETKTGEENAPEKENRISILALEDTLEPDPRFDGVDVPLPPAYKNVSWPQPGGEADHTLHHLQATGGLKTQWSADIGSGGAREVLTAPPIVADGNLFIMDSQARVTAYDVATGARKWRAELTPSVKEKFRVREVFARPDAGQIGFGGGVAYDNGKIFVTSGFGFAAALKADTGDELWRTQTTAPVRTPPTAYRGQLYFVTNTNEFIALDQETGEDKWKYQSFEEAARILSSSSPAAAGDLVVAPFSSGELVAFLADTGRPVWNETLARNSRLTSLSTLNDIAGSPVIDRGLIYVVSHAGQLAAIDIRTGGRIWEAPIASLQTPWVAGNFVFLVSVDAELVCIERESGAIVWVSQLRRFEKNKKRKGRIAWAGPIAAGDHLILANTRGEVVKVSPKDGSIVETRKVGDSFIVSPIVAEETIFVLSDSGKLSALK